MEEKNLWADAIPLDDLTPHYRQIEAIISKKITTGAVAVGTMLPTEKEFCTLFSVSRSTVRNAFALLEQKGLITRTAGLGTVVAVQKVMRNIDRLYSFTKQMDASGLKPSSTILEFCSLLVSSSVSLKTGFPLHEELWLITRVRKANDIPMLLEHTMILKRLCPDLQEAFLTEHSLYEHLTELGVEIDHATESYEPCDMDEETMELLSCDRREAFAIVRHGYTVDGKQVEYTSSIMPGERSRLSLTLRDSGVEVERLS